MPLCVTDTYCKEVIIPDKNGNPIGGLSCKEFCSKFGVPPGYEKWTKVAGPGSVTSPARRRVRLFDSDTGDLVEFTFEECEAIAAAYRRARSG